jgi:hypothetical protein
MRKPKVRTKFIPKDCLAKRRRKFELLEKTGYALGIPSGRIEWLDVTPERATGITIYLENDGRLEHAQQMAGHESSRTTKLYDRTKDEITLTEVERIRL